MATAEKISSVQEWVDLPQISLPSVGSAKERGSVYKVFKVGLLGVSRADCERMNLSVTPSHGDKCVLPTAVIEFARKRQLCRLPLELAPWTFECVAMANAGRNPFPSDVKFGVLEGRPYAEFAL